MKINEETREVMLTAKGNMAKYISIIDDIMSGTPVFEACEKKDIAPQTLYRKINYMTNEKKTKTEGYRNRKKVLNAYPVNIYKDVFIEYGNNVPEIPSDFNERINVLKAGLTDKEKRVFETCYVKSMALRDAGDDLGVSYETIRTIKKEILKKFRKTYSIEILLGKIALDEQMLK